PSGRLCRPHCEGREACGLAGDAANEISSACKSQDGEIAAHRHPDDRARPRRRGDRMKRREFIAMLGGAAAWAGAARGQLIPVGGYLHTQSRRASEAATAGFRKGLGEGGFAEGRNVTIAYRYADGQTGNLPALAADLVRRNVSVIAAMGGSRATLAAQAATAAIPIVFTMGDADPVTAGLVANLARPGGNITGVSLLGGLLGAKRLELIRELVPSAAIIGVLINPENRSAAAELSE